MKTLIKITGFNKICILILFFVSFSFAKNTEATSFGASFGILSEKIPATFFEITGYYIPNNNTEYFATLSYLLLGGGVGIGTKYYLKDKNETSLFVTGGISASILSDSLGDYEYFIGPHISMGLSISLIEKLKFIYFDDTFNININVGTGHVFYDEIPIGERWYPFLNTEMKIEI